MKTSARYHSLILAGYRHEHATEVATSWRSWPLLSRILTDARKDNAVSVTPYLPPHIKRHHAAQDAGQFSPWFNR